MADIRTTGPEPLAVNDSGALPHRVDVAIVGGGIIGVSAALWLSMRGMSVALFEKGLIGAEQSSRNWGWCRLAGRDLRELPLMIRAHELWHELSGLVEADTGYRTCGIVYASRTPEALDRHQRWIAAARDLGIRAEMLSPRQFVERVPGLTQPAEGALFTPTDGRAEPQFAAPLIARAAMARGATIAQRCAVRAIDVEAGRIAGIATERGRVRADTVIVAGGAWSRLLLKGVGLVLPQLRVLSSVYRTAAFDAGIESSLSFSSFALRKRLDGGYTVASSGESLTQITPDTLRFFFSFLPAYLAERKGMTLRFGKAFIDEALRWRPGDADSPSIYEAVRILDPRPHVPTLRRVRDAIASAIPSFRDVPVAQSWAGMIDVTPDAIPVISKTGIPGLVVGTGFSGHGFGIGPAAGEMLADLAMDRKTSSDAAPFALSRFSDGSKLDLQHWL